MNILTELCNWQNNLSHIDETHEIGGISIFSCDNPGWWVKINLKNTPYEDCFFREVSINTSKDGYQESSNDWLHCYVVDNVFNGAGDPSKLEEILKIFFIWIKENGYSEEYFQRL